MEQPLDRHLALVSRSPRCRLRKRWAGGQCRGCPWALAVAGGGGARGRASWGRAQQGPAMRLGRATQTWEPRRVRLLSRVRGFETLHKTARERREQREMGNSAFEAHSNPARARQAAADPLRAHARNSGRSCRGSQGRSPRKESQRTLLHKYEANEDEVRLTAVF